ncbi:MAG: hypothetical protein KA187_03580, partial [Arenimonas sp.]|nr:hypothetical protein [Arenimonas sp.]
MKSRHRPLVTLLLLALCAPAGAAAAPPMADVMAGEFAIQKGELPTAARYYLLAALQSDDPGLAERATRIALVAEQEPLATRALARWRALAPGSMAMQAATTSLALRQGEHETAIESARVLLALPDQAGFAPLLVVLSEARGDEAVIARSVMGDVFAQSLLPANLSAWLQFSGLARRLGDQGLSGRVLAAGLAAFPEDPRVQLLEAARLRGDGQLGAAREKLLALQRGGKLPPELLRGAASELALLGEPRAAAELLSQGPQDDASQSQRASWLLAAGDTPALERLYAEIESAGAVPPPGRRLLLGHVAEALERWTQAERWYAGVPRGEGHDLAQLRLALAREQLGQLARALDTLHELQADPTADGERIRDSYLLEAELLARGPQPSAAMAALERGLAVFEGDPALLYARAMAQERANNIDAALSDLRRIIDDNPRDAQALNAYAYTLAERRAAYEEALPYVKRAHA